MNYTLDGTGALQRCIGNLIEFEFMEKAKNVVFLLLDRGGKIIYINPSCTSVVGVDREHLLGRKLREVEPKAAGLEVLDTGFLRMGCSILEKFDQRLVAGSVVPVREGNNLLGALSIFSLYNKTISIRSTYIKRMVGASEKLRRVLEIILRVSRAGFSVLITGESGVGKELVAEAIHYASARRSGPFVAMNCAAIPEHLVESELFGYEAGAFTGASRSGKPGKIQLADGGTLFLDEVGDMSLGMQVKLLRAIEQKEIERLGGNQPVSVDFRIIAATNKNLFQMIQGGQFREDLYYRLNVIPLHVPPLRERRSDISLLCRYFLQGIASDKDLSQSTFDILLNYNWPGNIRQLKNAIEYGAIMSNTKTIEPKDLPVLQEPALGGSRGANVSIEPGMTLWELNCIVERKALISTLEATNFNKTETSKMLGISRQALYLKIKQHGIKFN